jgi:ELWxxDGT repeat protein
MRNLVLLVPVLLLGACGGGNGSSPVAITPPETTVPPEVVKPIVHFFSADNGSSDFQLWKTDGTEAGTAMVKVINASGAADVQVLGSVDGKAIFTANDGINGRELWVTDGTEAGTAMLKDIHAGTASISINTFSLVGNTLFFDAEDDINGVELWKTDGTAAGTLLVKDINPGTAGANIDDMVTLGNEVYFEANDSSGNRLWKSDGTAAGTVLVSSSAISPRSMAVSNATLYFNAYSSIHGAELWKSDGTTAGTVMVKDIRTGTTSSNPDDLVIMGGNVYFLAAESNAQGEELWRSDGTEAGTVLVKNINPQTTASFNNNGSAIAYLAAINGQLFFTARPSTATNIRGLWVSDGTEAGTISLYNAGAISNQASVSSIVVAETATYFDGYDAVNGSELWKSDGTVAGTVLVKDVVPGTGGSDFYSLGDAQFYQTPSAPVLELLDGSVLMVGYTPDKGSEVWKTDGTEAGTVIVKDINPDMGDGLDN